MTPIRILGLVFIFFICDIACLFAADETLTITTYYPSPYGVYKTLRLYPNDTTDPTAACTNPGEMYFDDSEDKLYVCSGATWQAIGAGGGYWTASGNNIYNTNTGNVGIGTTTPGAKLEVNGAIKATDGTLIYKCPYAKSQDSECTSYCVGQLTTDATCTYYYDDSSSQQWACPVSAVSACTAVGRMVSN